MPALQGWPPSVPAREYTTALPFGVQAGRENTRQPIFVAQLTRLDAAVATRTIHTSPVRV
jgi:hypothetical protein